MDDLFVYNPFVIAIVDAGGGVRNLIHWQNHRNNCHEICFQSWQDSSSDDAAAAAVVGKYCKYLPGVDWICCLYELD